MINFKIKNNKLQWNYKMFNLLKSQIEILMN